MLFSCHQEAQAQRKPIDADEKWIPPRDVQQKREPFGTAAQMGIAEDIVRFGSWLQLPHLRGWTDFKGGKTGQMVSDFCGSKGRHTYIYISYLYIYIDRCISSFLSEGHNLMQKSSSLMLSGNRRVTWLESDLQLLFVTGKTLFKITMNSVDTTRKGFHTTIRISFRIERIGFFFWQRRGNIWNKSPDSGAMGCWWLVHFHFLQCPLIHSSFMGAEVSKAD